MSDKIHGHAAHFVEHWRWITGAGFQPEVIIRFRLFIALPLLALVAGCASNEPRQAVRAGGPYFEEIKSPVPRDTLQFGSDCIVR